MRTFNFIALEAPGHWNKGRNEVRWLYNNSHGGPGRDHHYISDSSSDSIQGRSLCLVLPGMSASC